MATRKQFLTTLAKYGGSVDETHDDVFYVESPPGKVWLCDMTHVLCQPFANNGGQSWKPEAYDDAIARMKYGVTPCADPECEECNPE